MQTDFLRYLMANRSVLLSGASAVEVDFGFGPVAAPPRVYQDLSRLDLRDEILKIPEEGLARVKEAIPAGVLDAYLVPPLGQLPCLSGSMDTFPSPEGIGVLDRDAPKSWWAD